MARDDTFYISPSSLHRKQRLQMWDGDVRILRIDLNAIEADRATTAASVTWETNEGTSPISLADAAVSAGIASVEVTAEDSGDASLSCTVSFADTTKAVIWWEISITDPA